MIRDAVERFAAMAAGIAWTRGVLDQAGLLDSLTSLPRQLRLRFPSGTTVLGVHASPQSRQRGHAPDSWPGDVILSDVDYPSQNRKKFH